MSNIVIAAAKRTAIGSFLGQFNGVPTPPLARPPSPPPWSSRVSRPATFLKS
jgi:hypothetical protein